MGEHEKNPLDGVTVGDRVTVTRWSYANLLTIHVVAKAYGAYVVLDDGTKWARNGTAHPRRHSHAVSARRTRAVDDDAIRQINCAGDVQRLAYEVSRRELVRVPIDMLEAAKRALADVKERSR